MQLFGGIEAGGSKFVCAIGTGPELLVERVEFPTTGPADTLARAGEFFRAHDPVTALGVASFGPVDLRDGRIAPTTPKIEWRNVAIASEIRRATGISQIALDTDVNAAALAESRWGAAQGLDTFLYITVGTGIGGGALVNGKLLHGALHPEMGHLRIPHDATRDPFRGCCPHHGDCLEGLASGQSIELRWGIRAEELPQNHAARDLEAGYLALGLANWIVTLSPQRVIVGGGVSRSLNFEDLRRKTGEVLNGYVETPDIVPPGLLNNAGVLGAIALAQTCVCV